MKFLPHIRGGEETRRSLRASLLLLVLVIVCPLALNSCRGDGGGGAELTEEEEETPVSPTEPANVTLKDAAGNTIELTGSSGCVPTSFTLTFDQAMDQDSVTRPGHITLHCEDMPRCEITVEQADEEGKEYTVTVEDAYKYQLKECRLTISRDVTAAQATATSASKALGEDVSFTFTNACAISDDFNADSQGCWTALESWTQIGGGDELYWSSWEAILGDEVVSFDRVDSSVLVLDDTRNAIDDDRSFALYKLVDIPVGGIEVIMHFKKASGFTAPDAGHEESDENPDSRDSAWFIIASFEETPEGSVLLKGGYMVGLSAFGEKDHNQQYCVVEAITGYGVNVLYGIPCGGEDHYIRLKYTSESVEINYAGYDVGDCEECWSDFVQDDQLFPYIEFRSEPEPFPYLENLSGSGVIVLNSRADKVHEDQPWWPLQPHDNYVEIDSVVVTGVTSSGQY